VPYISESDCNEFLGTVSASIASADMQNEDGESQSHRAILPQVSSTERSTSHIHTK
jgi:hypothetical protein